FRKDYGRLGSLRALFPKGIPFCLLSASFRPRVLKDVTSKLGFDNTAVIINVGNKRSNVALIIRPMVFTANSYKDLDFLVTKGTEDIDSIQTTMVYIDNVLKVTDAVIYLNNRLGPLLQQKGIIRPIHAWMPSNYRTECMDALIDGKIRIVICTEAAGMVSVTVFTQRNQGCDIPRIALVIQLGLCKSIDGLIQRVGRAARSGEFQGKGVLIAEPWAW
ncbi:hypothetical protein BOTBODRAFT_73972, partial [Botryobasidium botryosum FD-172 SS1]